MTKTADVVAHRVRPRTYESYEYVVRVHLRPALGDIRLVALRPDHVQRMITEKMETGLSNRTVQYIQSVLSRALNQAVRWDLVPCNVAKLANPPRPRRREIQTMTPEQVRVFLDSVRDHRLYALYVLAISTGMRQGELLGLRWSAVHLQEREIRVTHALHTVSGQGMKL